MRVAVTGTPGTGKTTATEALSRVVGNDDSDASETGESSGEGDRDDRFEVVHLNEHVEAERLYTGIDEARDSLIGDIGGIEAWLDAREKRGDEEGSEGSDPDTGNVDEHRGTIVESHLAHLLSADRVVVLRCQPEELHRRLSERGVEESKATENAESEALDVILTEAVSRHGTENVYEIDTTDRSPDDVGEEIERVVAGEREPSAGTVSFLEYLA